MVKTDVHKLKLDIEVIDTNLSGIHNNALAGIRATE